MCNSTADIMYTLSRALYTLTTLYHQVNYTRTEAAAAEHGMSLLDLRLGLAKVHHFILNYLINILYII